jgi:uncharacterized membrane-anchored protein
VAVVNASDSSNGRYPNAGPLLLARAGVHLVDAPRSPIFDRLRDGDPLTIEVGRVLRAGEEIVSGRVLDADELQGELEDQRQRVDDALAAFAENTMDHLRQDADLLAGRIELPITRTRFRDRHALVVVRGTTCHRDLQALRAYIRDVHPVLVGVDGGADALIEAGHRPDMIVGDMDSASDAALRTGAELVVHAYPDGEAPGRDRLVEMGLEHTVVPAAGTSQDVAMLLADEKGAALIVSVGAHFNLIEFLDRSRGGMSSTFLTRLRVGEKLVDAKGVSRLYNPGVGGLLLILFVLVVLVLMIVVIESSDSLREFVNLLWLKIRVLLD